MNELPIVLVGLPGVGKSRVAEELGRTLSLPVIDTDAMVESSAGISIAEIFASEGEPQFRAWEAEAVDSALTQRAVVSLGGGAIETPSVQAALSGATVVHIEADNEVLLERIRRNHRRPLFHKDPEATLEKLAERRNPLYQRLRTISVSSTRGPVRDVVNQILSELWATEAISVKTDIHYPVLIGEGSLDLAVQLVPADSSQVLIVMPAVMESVGNHVSAIVSQQDREVFTFTVPDGEAQKDLGVVSQLWDYLGQIQFGRRDTIIALGGGATTDLAGFVAATWMRGVPIIQLPSTLLAMVDAAVGGKTGINSSAGKNLIGSFHSPIAVGADTSLLRTLPERDYRAGLGEVIKCGFIADEVILDLVRDNPDVANVKWATNEGLPVLKELIRRAVAVKADIVGKDLKEGGLREILNYGHTLAHVIEKDSDFTVHHGEAVAIGSVFAAHVAAEIGLIGPELVEQHREAFSVVGLPISTEGPFDRFLDSMYLDKKTRGQDLRFVLLHGPQQPLTEVVDPTVLHRAWLTMNGR